MQRNTILSIFAFLALVSLISEARATKTYDLIVGTRIQGDFLLEQQIVEKSSFPFLQFHKSVTIKGDGVARITSIEVLDLKPNGNNAEPAVTNGGIDQTFVTIDFKSKRGHGIHFLVKVYGK